MKMNLIYLIYMVLLCHTRHTKAVTEVFLENNFGKVLDELKSLSGRLSRIEENVDGLVDIVSKLEHCKAEPNPKSTFLPKGSSTTQPTVEDRNTPTLHPKFASTIYTTDKERAAIIVNPPIGIKTKVLSANSIILAWTDLSLDRNNTITDNRYYTVRYRSLPKRGKYRKEKCTSTIKQIDGLVSNTLYEFSVRVSKGRVRSLWSISVQNRTDLATTDEAYPRNLTAKRSDIDPLTVILTWEAPASLGQIAGYLIFYTRDSNQNVEGVVADTLSTKIHYLTPSSTYYFKIQAITSRGYGPMSPVIIYNV